MIAAQAALADERDGACRKRLTAFRQHRRLARLVFGRLRRMRVMIAGRSIFMMRSGRRAWCGGVFGAHGIRPSGAQVEQRCRKSQREESTRGHGCLSEMSVTGIPLPLHRRGPEHRTTANRSRA